MHRFVQYNVLSPNLASPSHYERSPPEALDERTRKAKILQKLDAFTRDDAIIALQEVPLHWTGALTLFFKEREYFVSVTNYGNSFDGFMGVALAFPEAKYRLAELSVVAPPRKMARAAANLQREEKEAAKSVVMRTRALLRTLVDMLPFRPLYEPVVRALAAKAGLLKDSKPAREGIVGRWNRAILARLAPTDGTAEFAVGTYHVPCMFWDHDAMAMHVALVAECLDDFAGQVPRVLLGDFNIKPEDSGYRMLTTGHLAGDVEARIQHRFFPGWRLKLQAPLASAYCLARGIPGAGGEPAFTNHTFSRDRAFTGVLDYIFVSPHWHVADVMDTPPLNDDTPIYPNHDEPSDHIAIAATLTLEKE